MTAVRRLSPQDLPQIQGNILAPFKRRRQRFLFFTFGNNQDDAREWLGGIRPTSTAKLSGGDVQDPLITVSLTASALVTLHPELAPDVVGYDAFWRGALADRQGVDGRWTPSPVLVGDPDDSDPRRWLVGGPDQPPVDAVLILAGDDEDAFDNFANPHGAVRMFGKEDGTFIDGGFEHFGFKDGISQPGIRGFSAERQRDGRLEVEDKPGTPIIAAGEFVLGYEREAGSYPDAPRPDPPSWMHDGSFHVFLRLTQDVDGWNRQMEELSNRLGVDAGALAIGRTKDGAPRARPGDTGADRNKISYAADTRGEETPRCSHIRKMNPRDDALFHARPHQLLRRGIPFVHQLGGGGEERGLAFNAYTADIESSVEFLMRAWASNPRSQPERQDAADGPDPVVGASAAPFHFWSDERLAEIPFKRCVRTSGAVYAFTPSLPTLDLLANPQPIPVGPVV